MGEKEKGMTVKGFKKRSRTYQLGERMTDGIKEGDGARRKDQQKLRGERGSGLNRAIWSRFRILKRQR